MSDNLDRWLDAMTTSLHASIDEAVDLDAGLQQIRTTLYDEAVAGSAIVAFVDELSALPAVERLEARAWLPHHWLRRIRNNVAHAGYTHMVDLAPDLHAAAHYAESSGVARAEEFADAIRSTIAACIDGGPYAEVGGLLLIVAIIRVLDAVSYLAGDDLSEADLRGVPLDGVVWSTDTRWPAEWDVWVSANSVVLTEGLFQVRLGNAHVKTPVPV